MVYSDYLNNDPSIYTEYIDTDQHSRCLQYYNVWTQRHLFREKSEYQLYYIIQLTIYLCSKSDLVWPLVMTRFYSVNIYNIYKWTLVTVILLDKQICGFIKVYIRFHLFNNNSNYLPPFLPSFSPSPQITPPSSPLRITINFAKIVILYKLLVLHTFITHPTPRRIDVCV